ncbi:MAG: 7TM diverse intracellular signaling domain-containing protein [Bacteroidia bacterium]
MSANFYITILLFLSVHFFGVSNNVVTHTYTGKSIQPVKQVYHYLDTKSDLSPEKVILKKFDKDSSNSILNFGISNHTHWLKISIENKSEADQLLLLIKNAMIDHAELYVLMPDSTFDAPIVISEYNSFQQREYDDPDLIFKLNIKQDSSRTILLKLKSNEGIQIPLYIGTSNAVLTYTKNKGLLSGFYVGIMLSILLYNFFLYFSTNDRVFLNYVIYIALILLTQTSTQGYTFQYLWPELPGLARQSLIVFPCLVGVSGMIFMLDFLKIRIGNNWYFRIMLFFVLAYIFSLIFNFINKIEVSQKLMEITAMSVSMFMLITPIIRLRQGFKPAKFFLIAWSIFLIGIILFVLKDLGVIPYNNFTRYTMQIGSALETILLSFALADRINILKREKENSQLEKIKAIQENERLIKEQNVILEQKVAERTKDLEIALQDLKTTQVQLVNNEKMASLGQLTAGVAHEINNPINFVSGNIRPLKLDIKDLQNIINTYEALIHESKIGDLIDKAKQVKNQVDYNLIVNEIEILLNGIEEGAKRTSSIVSSLRTFSRTEENEANLYDIKEGILSTLLLLKSATPDYIKIVFSPTELPKIECYPGKINQLLMNILTNAIHAIKVKNKDSGMINIECKHEDGMIKVLIEDDGIGMTELTKRKIFDPFFTTKDVGEGTGLGMSIVYSIIEEHQGKISVESELGKGTKIFITLKLKLDR